MPALVSTELVSSLDTDALRLLTDVSGADSSGVLVDNTKLVSVSGVLTMMIDVSSDDSKEDSLTENKVEVASTSAGVLRNDGVKISEMLDVSNTCSDKLEESESNADCDGVSETKAGRLDVLISGVAVNWDCSNDALAVLSSSDETSSVAKMLSLVKGVRDAVVDRGPGNRLVSSVVVGDSTPELVAISWKVVRIGDSEKDPRTAVSEADVGSSEEELSTNKRVLVADCEVIVKASVESKVDAISLKTEDGNSSPALLD